MKRWGCGDGYYQDVDSSYNIENSWKKYIDLNEETFSKLCRIILGPLSYLLKVGKISLSEKLNKNIVRQ